MKNPSSDKRKSDFALTPDGADSLALRESSLGHRALPFARGFARPFADSESDPSDGRLAALPLGPPMTIRQAAQLIGCSVWTVRQRHLRNGLPYLRSRPSGKLTFYRDQVVAWILENQIQERRTS